VDDTEIMDKFRASAPTANQVELMEVISGLFGVLGCRLDRLAPEGRQKSLMWTHLEDAHQRANKAVMGK
jgi:hypothetical protein